jgi:hypothetical protein
MPRSSEYSECSAMRYLKMERQISSKMLVPTYQITHQNLENCIIHFTMS